MLVELGRLGRRQGDGHLARSLQLGDDAVNDVPIFLERRAWHGEVRGERFDVAWEVHGGPRDDESASVPLQLAAHLLQPRDDARIAEGLVEPAEVIDRLPIRRIDEGDGVERVFRSGNGMRVLGPS